MISINGTQINYYYICKTKLWLFSHNIHMEQESDNVKFGKTLHEDSYKKDNEVLIDNLINVDFIKHNNPIEIHEVKKTQSMKKSHEFQLLYYIYYLKKEKGLNNVVGYLNYPLNRKMFKIELISEKEKELESTLFDINKIICSDIPKPKKSRICRKCAYFEFCFC
ncbi:CRISPR-associated protein Cas4 [Methanobrevibacter sp. 87.7]|uniref:CRISPR-associated protein Cas4 n=1 Tax=Methanobrevibacter sp. 87.7 TaxID=387957 RepID=UPI000B509AA7|nr:CRISPR-associated protein Cas4 [Methanobrevibacter sp. 87.7]OWT33621.1 CRISPR-associated protein Cas4 [Methanobrevibacter sp. 87.7]